MNYLNRLVLVSEVLRTTMSYAASWNNNRMEEKRSPTRDSNQAPSAIWLDVLTEMSIAAEHLPLPSRDDK